MEILLLTIYVLVWPVIAAIVMGIIATNFFREWREARSEGRRII